MTLVRWNPMRNLISPWSEADRFLNDSLYSDRVWQPNADISESDAGYEVVTEIPGIKKEEVNISYQDNVLTISGEKKFEDEKKEKNYHDYLQVTALRLSRPRSVIPPRLRWYQVTNRLLSCCEMESSPLLAPSATAAR